MEKGKKGVIGDAIDKALDSRAKQLGVPRDRITGFGMKDVKARTADLERPLEQPGPPGSGMGRVEKEARGPSG